MQKKEFDALELNGIPLISIDEYAEKYGFEDNHSEFAREVGVKREAFAKQRACDHCFMLDDNSMTVLSVKVLNG